MAIVLPAEAVSSRLSNVLLVPAWWGDAATLAGATPEAGTVLTNLQTDQPTDVCGFPVASPVTITAARTSAQPFNTVAMLFANTTTDATWRVRVGQTAAVAASTTAPDLFASADGSLEGGATWADTSLVDTDGALRLANDVTGVLGQYVLVPAGVTIQTLWPTLEFLLMPDAIREQGLLSQLGSITRRVWMDASGHIVVDLAGASSIVSTAIAEPGVVTHVAIVHSGTTTTLYVDGVAQGSDTIGSYGDGFGDLRIGTIAGAGYSFSGLLAEVRLWNVERSEAQIVEAMGRRLIATEDTFGDLAGYWPLAGFDSGALRCWGTQDLSTWTRRHSLLYVPTGFTASHLQIDVTDPANPDIAVRIGRLVVGQGWQPTRAYKYGKSMSFADDSTFMTTPSGQRVPTVMESAPKFEFTLAYLTEEELLAHGYELARRHGIAKPLLCCLNPTDDDRLHEKLVYGLLEQPPAIVEQGFRQYEQQYRIESLR